MQHVLILGGDGYLGWPTAMYFSKRNYKVTVVDNYFRRNAVTEVDACLLYPIPSLVERARLWHAETGLEIKVVIGDLAEPDLMNSLFDGRTDYDYCIDASFSGAPDSVIHYAEQPSAPYSISTQKRADFTLINNLRVTNNLIWAVKQFSCDTHIIKLGTMGEYGTPNIDIEEGWLEVEHKGRKDKFLYPRQGGSVYHTTKIMDTDLLWFAVRAWNLRVTDLMQGPVYGIETEESIINPNLRTLFNYDEIFGTILNRFVTQAVVNYPLTVYGKGGQTRGYINIIDTLQCLFQSANNPPEKGKLRIFNQITETFSANQLADLVQKVGISRGHNVEINSLPNPRKEAEEHYYNPTYQGLQDIGVVPHYLNDAVLHEFFDIVESHKESIRADTIFRGVKW